MFSQAKRSLRAMQQNLAETRKAGTKIKNFSVVSNNINMHIRDKMQLKASRYLEKGIC